MNFMYQKIMALFVVSLAFVGITDVQTKKVIQKNKKNNREHERTKMLVDAPKTIDKVYEISVEYPESTPQYFNQLLLEEQVFLYYFWRACLPGNRIATDQHHRHGLEVMQLFEHILHHKDRILSIDTNDATSPLYGLDTKKIINDIQAFLTYLWTNHGQYFLRENGDAKRTPSTIGLTALTPVHLRTLLTFLDYPDIQSVLSQLDPVIFDATIDKKMTVPNDIVGSAVNIYTPDFTEKDYATLPDTIRKKINAYFYVRHNGDQRIPAYQLYSTTGKYAQELSVANDWLKKAYEHAQKYPACFDTAFITSLNYLIKYIETGDEEFFKKHSIEWLKSDSRIDYNFGFIESYHDPKGRRGFFQAEATVKTVDMKKLNALLPSIEKQLPMPAEWQREVLGAMPNASMNHQIFGFGHLGPTVVTAAYCLPNYEEIRSQYGSKQIIYPAGKSLEMCIEPALARKLFFPKEQAEWLILNDPDGAFSNDIWNLQCILHETLGHGSGRLASHTFIEGEERIMGDNTYEIGQTIPVTNENVSDFLAGYESTIEELRAEIIALYVSINHLDELATCGLMGAWVDKFGKEKVIEWLILSMADTGLRRIIQQSDDAMEISGDHARANSVIMNYLVNKGGLSVAEENLALDNKNYTVIGLVVENLELTKKLIQQLMVEVQAIKSTGNGIGAKSLVLTYGTNFRKPEYITILKHNRKTIVGDLKAKALLSPHFTPIYDQDGNITQVQAQWPKNIVEQFFGHRELELLK